MNKPKRTRRIISIESKIQKAQNSVLRAKARYEKAMAELERLINIRRKQQQKDFMDALEKSARTFEDVMRFLEG